MAAVAEPEEDEGTAPPGLWDRYRDVILQKGSGDQSVEAAKDATEAVSSLSDGLADASEDPAPPDNATANAVRAWQQPRGREKPWKESDSPQIVRRNVKWVRNVTMDVRLTLVGLHGEKIRHQFGAVELQDGILDMLKVAKYNMEKDEITVIALSGQSVNVKAGSPAIVDGIMHDAVNDLLKVTIGEEVFKVSFLKEKTENDKRSGSKQVAAEDAAKRNEAHRPLTDIHPAHAVSLLVPLAPAAGQPKTFDSISDLDVRSDSYRTAQANPTSTV